MATHALPAYLCMTAVAAAAVAATTAVPAAFLAPHMQTELLSYWLQLPPSGMIYQQSDCSVPCKGSPVVVALGPCVSAARSWKDLASALTKRQADHTLAAATPLALHIGNDTEGFTRSHQTWWRETGTEVAAADKETVT